MLAAEWLDSGYILSGEPTEFAPGGDVEGVGIGGVRVTQKAFGLSNWEMESWSWV